MGLIGLLKRLDLYIVIPVGFLIAMGLIVQFSIASKTTGIPIDINMATQIISLVIGLLLVLVMLLWRPHMRSSFALLVYILSIILLIIVQVAGTEINGSQRWISIGSFQLQPTELAKIGLILVLARLFDTRDATVNRLSTVIQSIIVTVIPAALIVVQPDLGSAIVLFVVWIAILYASRLKLSRLSLLLLVLFAGVVVMVPFMAEYQQERLISYFNPERDVSGSNYNVLQAGIALGSGGLTGNGLDAGSQSQLNFLPSQHTDFIFAVTGEKLGLIGTMSVVAMFALLYLRLSYLAWVTTNQYERGVLVGTVAMLFFHSFVNIGMNIGLLPVTGLPLPFISYGGTFLVATLLLIGICLSISWRIKESQKLSSRLLS